MSTEILFFGAIAILALITISLGISNWLFLSSVSAKITNLENEVEKKTSEFDALKKEKLAFAASQKNETFPQDRIDSSGYPEQGSQIEIVRNVPGSGFDHFDMEVGQKKHGHPQPVAPDVTAAAPAYPQQPRFETGYAPPPRPAGMSPLRTATPAQQTSMPRSDILDVVEEQPDSTSSAAAGVIRLALFSNSKKDTDFAAAWKVLSERLPGVQNPEVFIDFANVMFLYDRELQYLEKFRDVILQAAGNVFFINCDAELLAMLDTRPALARHIRR
jgi:hypothetical protein